MSVQREELVDYVTYERQVRSEILPTVLAAKAKRRIHLGDHLTFLFENDLTIRYQIQEMMRVEQIVREADIQHEIDTYNELLGGPGELGCTLLIEIATPEERAEKLRAWLGLPEYLYLEVEGGERVKASYDARQIGTERLSSVQYLKFDTKGRSPVALGVDHPALKARTELSAAQRAALTADLED